MASLTWLVGGWLRAEATRGPGHVSCHSTGPNEAFAYVTFANDPMAKANHNANSDSRCEETDSIS